MTIVDQHGKSVVDMSVPGRPEWEQKVAAETLAFAKAVGANFETGLRNSLAYLPDPKDKEQRAIQINYFFSALAAVSVQTLARFGSVDAELEKIFIDSVKDRFEYLREQKKVFDEANAAAKQ